MITTFKLENILTKEYILKNLPKTQVNNLPEINSILLRLKEFLDENKFSHSIVGHGQLYTYNHYFANGDFCSINWDIDKIKLIIETCNLPIEKLNVEKLAQTISKDAIDSSYIKKASKNEEPIIIAYLPMFQEFVILDGNHRVISRYIENKRIINGYILQPPYHFFAMTDDTSRAAFIALSALEFIKDYLTGNIPMKDLSKCIEEIDDFYSISVQKEMIDMLSGK